jgi:hypothetical protein
MSFSVKKSTQFKINELVIMTKAGPIDVSQIFEELNLFDSILMPVTSGSILIRDSVGLSGKLLFDGSESILIDIAKDAKSDIATFKKAFRIYKQSGRKAEGLNTELFVLNFVSDELIFSDQQKINQSFEGTYSKVVEKVLVDYLRVPNNQIGGIFEPTTGIRKLVIPNLKPLDAIEWCAKRSVDQNQAPNYMFFQNLVGFNFVSLSKLLTQPDLLDIRFELKNQSKGSALSEIGMARALEVVAQTDMIEKTRSGVNAGQFIGFDPLTRTTAKKQIGFADVFNSMKHANENPNQSVVTNRAGVSATEAYDSKKSMAVMDAAKQLSNYIKKMDPTSISKIDNIENWLFQRKAIINNLMNKRVKLAMPGNFQLTSGFNINLEASTFGKKEKGGDNDDPSLSGKYIIVASRHIIGYDKHETIIEVATTSTNNDFIPVSNPQQTEQLLNY